MSAPGPAASLGGPLQRFFTNQSRFEFVGRSRLWAIVSAVLLVLAVASLLGRGLNFSIEFTGGTSFATTGVTEEFSGDGLRQAIRARGVDDVTVQVVEDGAGVLVLAPELEEVGGERERAILDEIAAATGVERQRIDVNAVGPRWGERITEQAVRALVAFLVLIVAYITLRFEWRMAVAALATLAHDLVVTVGVYALVGFHVSPASVIALLTILGYSLYDTVVVFDRVAEDAAKITSTASRTYGEVANEAVNQVLLRSLSTSVTSLLPVGSLLIIGAQLLGADTLQDLALALFVGMAVGTYSSIVVATPIMVALKERQPEYAELRRKILARRGGESAAAVQGAGNGGGSGAGGGARRQRSQTRRERKGKR